VGDLEQVVVADDRRAVRPHGCVVALGVGGGDGALVGARLRLGDADDAVRLHDGPGGGVLEPEQQRAYKPGGGFEQEQVDGVAGKGVDQRCLSVSR
jgi:hypothetical protein